MVLIHDLTDPRLVEILLLGGIAVIRTDTLYGLVASANNEQAVEKIYAIKHRQPHKQLITLISSTDQLMDDYAKEVHDDINKLWPGKNSIVLPSSLAPAWLLRGGDSLAYRLPNDEILQTLLYKTGPLVAPSANPESLPPAMTINEAINYFGDTIDMYVDGGNVTEPQPSRLYRLMSSGEFEQLR